MTDDAPDKIEWILYPRDDRDTGDKPDPWEPWYDCCFKMVVRAESETEAREIAQAHAKSEKRISPVHHDHESVTDRAVWTDSTLTMCIPLADYTPDRNAKYADDERLLIQDIHHA